MHRRPRTASDTVPSIVHDSDMRLVRRICSASALVAANVKSGCIREEATVSSGSSEGRSMRRSLGRGSGRSTSLWSKVRSDLTPLPLKICRILSARM